MSVLLKYVVFNSFVDISTIIVLSTVVIFPFGIVSPFLVDFSLFQQQVVNFQLTSKLWFVFSSYIIHHK